jgi:hypothetical protein
MELHNGHRNLELSFEMFRSKGITSFALGKGWRDGTYDIFPIEDDRRYPTCFDNINIYGEPIKTLEQMLLEFKVITGFDVEYECVFDNPHVIRIVRRKCASSTQ